MSDPATWEQLSHATRDALWKAAKLAEAPLPASVLTGGEEGVVSVLGPPSRQELVTLRLHPRWGHSVRLAPQVRSAIRAGVWTIGGHQLDALQDLVTAIAGLYFSHHLTDPSEMRESAAELEPHLDTVVELGKRLELWPELAQLLHRRAQFVSWDGAELERALRYAQESVNLFRKTDGGKPHPGTLALFQSALAHCLFRLGRTDKAREVLLEAEQHLLRQLGSDGVEPFLFYCQLAQTCQAAGDTAQGARAKREAEELADDLAEDAASRERLRHHVGDPRPWSWWHLHRYAGL